MTGMSLELAAWDAPSPVENVLVAQVLDDAATRAYIELTLRRWEIPDDERELVSEVHRHRSPGLCLATATSRASTARRSARRISR
jgi:hypothetical protein